MPEDNMNVVLDSIKKTTEEMRSYVDRKVEEAAKGKNDPLIQEAIDKANADIDQLTKRYDELVVASKRPSLDDSGKEVDEKAELRKSAFLKFCRYGNGETSSEVMSQDEKRALQESSDAEGGFLVPIDFTNELIMNAYDMAEIRPVVGATPTGRDTVFFGALAKPTVAWGTTGVAVTAQDLDVGGHTMTIHDLKALTLIHNNTLEDAEADIWAELNMAFSDAIAEAEDDAFAVGAGSHSPQGIMTNALVQANVTNSGVAADVIDASNDGVTALITAYYKLKKTYRRNATIAMNSTLEGKYRNSKDADGQYLWQPPVQAGDPATLLGRPVINPEGMPDVAANAFPVVIGDFRRGYRIKDRSGIAVQRLSERYAEYDQTGFLIKKRVGGQVVLPEAFQVIKCST